MSILFTKKARVRRKLLTKENYDSYLKNTPSRRYGSNRLFRNLEDRGIISYSEYLFLLCVITSKYLKMNIFGINVLYSINSINY